MENISIVFIHGYRSKSKIFKKIRNDLRNFDCHLFDYDYDANSLDKITLNLDKIVEKVKHNNIVFICHSMGGLILNYYLQDKELNIRNIFYISSPFQLKYEKVKDEKFKSLLENKIVYKDKINVINSYLEVDNKNSYEKYNLQGLDTLNDGVINLDDTKITGVKSEFTIKGKDHFWVLFDKKLRIYISDHLI